jgi:hypothetical protein
VPPEPRPSEAANDDRSEAVRIAFVLRTFATIDLVAKAALAGFLGWKALDTIGAYAGTSTEVALWLDTLISVDFTVYFVIPWSLAAFLARLWWRERKLRHEVTERLQGRITELESRLDPQRSSSELTTRGTTNPRDRLW